MTICVRPEELKASARIGRPGANQMPAELKRVIEKPQWMRLEFSNGILVDMPRQEYLSHEDQKEWVVEFPPNSLRVL